MRCKRILLTGITGFLGRNLANELSSRGFEIIALKRKSSNLSCIGSCISNIIFFDVEDLDYFSLFNSENKIDVVIHTATNYGRNGENPSEVFATNTVFPLKLLEAGCNGGIGLFINTDTILDKYLNLYSLSKNQFLQWGNYFSRKEKIRFVNMKLEHIYGPGDDNSKFTAHVIDSCISNKPLLELTLGEQCRDFIYVDDVVAAYLAVLEKEFSENHCFVEYEVGSGSSVSIKEFVEKVHEMTASKTELHFGAIPYRDGEVMNSQANIASLRELGWNCKYSLEQGLWRTIKGIRK